MTSPEFEEHIQYAFEAFCKKLLKNRAQNLHRKLNTQEGREITMSCLPTDVMIEPSYEDEYGLTEPLLFGKTTIYFSDPRLRAALASLLPKYREVLLLSYFMEYSDAEIGAQLGIPTSTVSGRRRAALRKLKEKMGKEYDF